MTHTPDRTQLRTGPLSLHLEHGRIAGLTLAGRTALGRIYPSLRGPGWSTIPDQPIVEHLAADQDGFTARIRHEYCDGASAFTWILNLAGQDGRITITATGRTATEITAERLGLCLLHPEEHTGTPFTATTSQGTLRSAFTTHIEPHRLAHDITSLSVLVADDCILTLAFHGATFDLEDHRNWSDPGWKTYSPSLDQPHPMRYAAGTALIQRVEISYQGAAHSNAPRPRPRSAEVIMIGGDLEDPLPELSTLATRETVAPPAERHPRPPRRHLFYVWDATDPNALAAVARICAGPASTLDIAVLLSAEPALPGIAETLAAHAPLLRRISVFDATSLTTLPGPARVLCDALREAGLRHQVGAGSLTAYAGLNRIAHDLPSPDFLTFGLSAQTHHSDDGAVMDTISIQPAVLDQAICQGLGKPVVVGPITFRRHGETRPDSRMATRFHAAWLLATISALRRANGLILGDIEPDAAPAGACTQNPVAILVDTVTRQCARPLRRTAVDAAGLAVLAWDDQALISNLEPSTRTLTVRGAAQTQVQLGPYETLTMPLRVACRTPARRALP